MASMAFGCNSVRKRCQFLPKENETASDPAWRAIRGRPRTGVLTEDPPSLYSGTSEAPAGLATNNVRAPLLQVPILREDAVGSAQPDLVRATMGVAHRP